MAANRPSNGSTLSRMALGAPGPAASPQNDRESEKAAWLCLLTPPAARLFLLIATSLGVVQSGLNFTDKWRISQFAGAGSFADVYAAKGEDDVRAAVKILKSCMSQASESTELCWSKFAKEIKALRALQKCPNLPKLYGAFLIRARDGDKRTINLCMVMQYFETRLQDLREIGPLSELVLRPILKDILRAIRFLHAKCFAHRDVKTANVMLRTPAGPACLIDFGFAVRVEETVKIQTLAGTAGYLAPELFGSPKWDRRQADMFSFASCVGKSARVATPSPNKSATAFIGLI